MSSFLHNGINNFSFNKPKLLKEYNEAFQSSGSDDEERADVFISEVLPTLSLEAMAFGVLSDFSVRVDDEEYPDDYSYGVLPLKDYPDAKFPPASQVADYMEDDKEIYFKEDVLDSILNAIRRGNTRYKKVPSIVYEACLYRHLSFYRQGKDDGYIDKIICDSFLCSNMAIKPIIGCLKVLCHDGYCGATSALRAIGKSGLLDSNPSYKSQILKLGYNSIFAFSGSNISLSLDDELSIVRNLICYGPHVLMGCDGKDKAKSMYSLPNYKRGMPKEFGVSQCISHKEIFDIAYKGCSTATTKAIPATKIKELNECVAELRKVVLENSATHLELRERNGIVLLYQYFNNGMYILDSEYGLDDLEGVVDSTIKRLDNINLPIKSIAFPAGSMPLSCGAFTPSLEEKGSYSLILK